MFYPAHNIAWQIRPILQVKILISQKILEKCSSIMKIKKSCNWIWQIPQFYYFPLFPLFLLFIFLNLPPSDILTNYRQIGESRIQRSYKK